MSSVSPTVESMRGIMREMRGRRVGRQAQIMPTLHSIADQDAAPTLSSDKIRDVRLKSREWWRGRIAYR